MKSIAELRQQLQVPMRRYNDIGGLLFADWVSIYITWLFLRFGIGPTPATIGMLVVGLSGAALLPFGGTAAVFGGVLLVCFYILDCVDGEVARFQKVDKYLWTFHGFFFGYFVKSAFYIGLAIYAFRLTQEAWILSFGLAAVLALLFKAFLDQVALFLTARHVFLRTKSERKNILKELSKFRVAPAESKEIKGPSLDWFQALSMYGGFLGIVRSIFMSFDLSILGFIMLAVLDLWVSPVNIFGTLIDLKTVFILVYGVVLPLNFFNHLFYYVRSDKFYKDSARLLSEIGTFSDNK
ncbi:MAG: hypothetical protein GKS00_13185 [Alphaproteobacteria bacterium]|nr:hypothetical protein [Alphaproteobacteria bacterium]